MLRCFPVDFVYNPPVDFKIKPLTSPSVAFLWSTGIRTPPDTKQNVAFCIKGELPLKVFFTKVVKKMSFFLDKVCRFWYFKFMSNVAKPKLNPLHALNRVEVLISEIKPTPEKTFHVCLFLNRLEVLPHKHTKLQHTIFFKFPEGDIRRGFTGGQWNRMLNKFAAAIKAGILKPEHIVLGACTDSKRIGTATNEKNF